MKYPYQQFPNYCWYCSVPYTEQQRSSRESATEALSGESSQCIKIGDPAPDFNLDGVLGGEKINIKLSDQRGRWAVVFFYASDFTFV
jgi:hypothetical protein